MSKTQNSNSNVPTEKSSYSTGTRGESALQRNISGNHHGNRQKSRRPLRSGKH
jgi:hypothetical protein